MGEKHLSDAMTFKAEMAHNWGIKQYLERHFLHTAKFFAPNYKMQDPRDDQSIGGKGILCVALQCKLSLTLLSYPLRIRTK